LPTVATYSALLEEKVPVKYPPAPPPPPPNDVLIYPLDPPPPPAIIKYSIEDI
jgi:hypothetical protein